MTTNSEPLKLCKDCRWAKVEVRYGTCALGDTREVFVVTPWEETKFYDDALADGYARKINRALSPLLARAELLERAVEEIRSLVSGVRWVEQLPPALRGLPDILTAYASLPKMPGQGEIKEGRK